MTRIGSPSRINPFIALIKDMLQYGLEKFGRYYSTYRGFVADNKDPDNCGRLKLIIPEVGGDTPFEYWAHAKNVFSGPKYGVQLIPQKGDVVWVEFEQGHPEVPIWSHGYFGLNEPPTDDEDLKDVNCYWFITPGGHKIKVNDTKSYIHIQHKGGQTVVITDTSISLVSDKKISLGSKDVSAQAAMLGDTTKELLTQIKGYLDNLKTGLTLDATTLAPYAPNTLAFLPDLTERVADITVKLEKILSTKTTLD